MGAKIKFEAANFPDFKVIPGFSAYVISKTGEIISLYSGRVKSTFENHNGYLACGVQDDSGKTRHKAVHRLVALTYLGPKPKGLIVCHNNGDRLDSRLDNLRYDTYAANAADSLKHGTRRLGPTHPNAVLTDLKALAIKMLYHAEGPTRTNVRELSAMFNISPERISKISNGKEWKHLPPKTLVDAAVRELLKGKSC